MQQAENGKDHIDRTLVWVFICTLISNSAYALIAPFLPIEFMNKGIEEQTIGLIFAIYSVAVIIFSPMVGKSVQVAGQTNLITMGVFVMGLCFVLFGIIDDMESTTRILYFGLVLRFIQGISSSFVQVTCYSIATNDYPVIKDKIVGWLEALTGLGLIVGPIIGSLLYSAMGFKHAFFIYGGFLMVLSLIIKLNFPDDSSEQDDDFVEAISAEDGDQ